MPLSHIEHFLIAADDIDATRDWYARVLGMKPGPHPDFGFPVHWMYLGGVGVAGGDWQFDERVAREAAEAISK